MKTVNTLRPDVWIFDFFQNFETLFRAFWVPKRTRMHPEWILNNKLAPQTAWKQRNSPFYNEKTPKCVKFSIFQTADCGCLGSTADYSRDQGCQRWLGFQKPTFFRFWMFFGCFSSVTRSGGFKSLCKYQKSILHQILRFYSGGENFLAVFQLENMKKPRFWSKIQLISLI